MSRPGLARVQATKKNQKGNMLNSLVMLSPFDGVYPEPSRRTQGRRGLVGLGTDPSLLSG